MTLHSFHPKLSKCARLSAISMHLVLFSILLVGNWHAEASAGEDAKSYTEEELRRSDWIDEGMQKFNSACTYCHGNKGQGGKVKSFTERSGWDPRAIHDVITNGRTRGSNVMPPWGGSLSDEEIWMLVAYIKSLSIDFKGRLPSPKNAP